MANPMTESPNIPLSTGNRFYGEHRGIAIQNIDPEQVGRVRLNSHRQHNESLSRYRVPSVKQ